MIKTITAAGVAVVVLLVVVVVVVVVVGVVVVVVVVVVVGGGGGGRGGGVTAADALGSCCRRVSNTPAVEWPSERSSRSFVSAVPDAGTSPFATRLGVAWIPSLVSPTSRADAARRARIRAWGST